VARRVQRWEWATDGVPIAWTGPAGPELFLRRAAQLVQLLPDGTGCVRGPPAAYEDVSTLSDMDADGTPEGLGSSTCSGCTSNHIVVGGA